MRCAGLLYVRALVFTGRERYQRNWRLRWRQGWDHDCVGFWPGSVLHMAQGGRVFYWCASTLASSCTDCCTPSPLPALQAKMHPSHHPLRRWLLPRVARLMPGACSWRQPWTCCTGRHRSGLKRWRLSTTTNWAGEGGATCWPLVRFDVQPASDWITGGRGVGGLLGSALGSHGRPPSPAAVALPPNLVAHHSSNPSLPFYPLSAFQQNPFCPPAPA